MDLGMRKSLLLLLIFFLPSCSWAEYPTFNVQTAAVIVVPDPPVHDFPNEGLIQNDKVRIGDVFFVTDSMRLAKEGKSVWYRVLLSNGALGWIAADGLIITSIALIDVIPGSDSTALFDTLPAGKVIAFKSRKDTFSVLGVTVQKDKDLDHWRYFLKVRHLKCNELNRKRNEGWVRNNDVSLSYVSLWLESTDRILTYDKYHDKSAVESLNVRLLDEYPSQYILNRSQCEAEVINTKIAALLNISRLYCIEGNFNKAINMLGRIITEYPNDKIRGASAVAMAKLRMAEIYWEELHQFNKALELYHEMIRLYPREQINYYEDGSQVGLAAFDGIRRMILLFDFPKEVVIKEYNKVIGESKCDLIKAMAYLELINSCRKFGMYDEAIMKVEELIRFFPAMKSRGFKEEAYFAADALRILCHIYVYDLRAPNEGIKVFNEIYITQKDENPELARGAMFYENVVKDRSLWPRDEVIAGYERFLRTFGEYRDAQERLRVINMLEQQNGYVRYDSSALRAAPVLKGSVLKIMNRGDKLFAYYWIDSVDSLYDYRWFKVIAEDSTLGWIKETQIHLEKFHVNYPRTLEP